MKTLNRRQFIQHSVAVPVLAVTAPVLAVAAVGGHDTPLLSSEKVVSSSLKTSIMSYAFHGLLRRGMIDLFGYLETSKYRYHLQAVHLWSGYFESTDEAYLMKVKEAVAERELAIGEIAVDGAHVWDDDSEVRAKNHENAKAYLNAARFLGIPFVRIDAGGNRETMVWTDDEFDHIVGRFKEYAQYAQDHGFRVGAENHWGPEKRWDNYQKLYHAVDHPAFGLSCHLGSWAGTEEEKRIADRECAPWVCCTHIDWNICTGPLLEEKLTNLWNVGYAGYYSVEHHTGKDEYREVEIQLALVRDKLERFKEAGAPGTSEE